MRPWNHKYHYLYAPMISSSDEVGGVSENEFCLRQSKRRAQRGLRLRKEGDIFLR